LTPQGVREEPVSWVAYLRYLTPTHYSNDLLHPAFGPFAASAGALVAFAAVYLFAAWAVLRQRDA
jgi:hypothetical protein